MNERQYNTATAAAQGLALAQTDPVGRVRSEQEALEKQLHELSALGALLIQRLEPVLLPAMTEACGEQTAQPEPARSPVAYHANFMLGMVNGMTATVRDILNRHDV